MGETLQFASEKEAYTLSDRGTYLAMRSNLPDLVVLVGGDSLAENHDPNLINPYAVIRVNPDLHPQTAAVAGRLFVEWVTSLEIQERIGQFGAEPFEHPLFFPDSDEWRSAHPQDGG
jgi:tungstate transport system substrate-binding protein